MKFIYRLLFISFSPFFFIMFFLKKYLFLHNTNKKNKNSYWVDNKNDKIENIFKSYQSNSKSKNKTNNAKNIKGDINPDNYTFY